MDSKTGNQLNLEIIACHGWGFDSGFWENWQEILPDGVNFKTADRGYFLEEKRPKFSNEPVHKILFLHSYAVHWCPQNIMDESTCIVIFNGFKRFHPKDEKGKKQSKRLLDAMISEFDKKPKEVLTKFWHNAFSPEKKRNLPGFKFDEKILLQDLKNLHTSTFEIDRLKNGKPIISLDGGNDKILQTARGKTFTEFTDGNAVYHFIKEAGHALPVTHSQDCWSFISAMIPIFQHNGNYRRKRNRQSGQ